MPDKFLYRDKHSGGNFESLKTTREMESYYDLEAHIFNIYGDGDITFEPFGVTAPLVGKNTCFVKHNGIVVGFTDRLINKSEVIDATSI